MLNNFFSFEMNFMTKKKNELQINLCSVKFCSILNCATFRGQQTDGSERGTERGQPKHWYGGQKDILNVYQKLNFFFCSLVKQKKFSELLKKKKDIENNVKKL